MLAPLLTLFGLYLADACILFGYPLAGIGDGHRLRQLTTPLSPGKKFPRAGFALPSGLHARSPTSRLTPTGDPPIVRSLRSVEHTHSCTRPSPMDLILRNGMLAQIDPEDADLAQHRWRAWYKRSWKGGWVVTREFGPKPKRKRVYLHRAIAFRIAFVRPQLMCVSPIDGNFLNCRRSNLHVYEKGWKRLDHSNGGEPNSYERYTELVGQFVPLGDPVC